MIFHATNLKESATFTANNAANIFVESLANLLCDDRSPMLRAEDDVVQQIGVGVRHGLALLEMKATVAPPGLWLVMLSNPGLAPRARCLRPSGAGFELSEILLPYPTFHAFVS